MKTRMLLITALAVLGLAAHASATTTLGVATDAYAYYENDSLSDEYVRYFTGSSIYPAISPEYHGFIVGASGSNLTIFSLYNPATTPVWLLSNTGTDNNPMSFGGRDMLLADEMTKKIAGYTELPYNKLLLLSDLPWTTHVFEATKTFYLYTAPINYSGELTPGDYFFAMADTDGNGLLNNKDDFSPKTTSAGGFTPVPEPSGLMLLGSGLLGLIGVKFGRKA